MQVGATNIASGSDVVGVQAGRLGDPTAAADASAAQWWFPAADDQSFPVDEGDVTTTNVRAGNARVGLQTDVVTGSINITMPDQRVTVTPKAPTAGGAPTREQTDQMAAKLPANRKGWAGSDLSEKDRRFFALRDSGYKGPIDQDGYADTTSEGAGILRRMAQGRGEDPNW